jgi:hypothetical protein
MQTPSCHLRSGLLWLLLATALGGGVCDAASTILNRKNEVIRDHVVAPFPSPTDPNTNTAWIGKASYALAAYYLNTNLTTANSYLNSLWVADNTEIDDPATGNLYPFVLQGCLLARMALGTDTNGVRMTNSMSVQARTNLLDMLWKHIRQRSKYADGGSSSNKVWLLQGTENHNAGLRSTYFLAAQVLKGAGYPYGTGNPRNTLADGKTLQQHYDNWNLYWKEYFRQRAREGMHVEVASPTYEKFTVACFYNIRDCAADTATQDQAEKFLTLYWADASNDYLVGATIRGGPGCRMYQNTSLTLGTTHWIRPWLYVYDWHDVDPGAGSHPMILCSATSDYLPPDIVAACATNAGGSKVSSGPYDYASRRLGRGVDNANGTISLLTPGYIRRDTYWTPEYVLGGMTYRSTYPYAQISAQNRFAGMIFSNGVNDRLIVQGIGTGGPGGSQAFDRDNYGITAACYQNTLIAARDANNTANDGVRIFFSNGQVRNNVVTNGSWLFTSAGNGYAGIRIATGGFTWDTNFSPGVPCNDGIFLELTDKWSPLVIQGGRAVNYSSFANFQSSVKSNSFVWNGTDSSMTYTNEVNVQFKIWKQNINDALPYINGAQRFQNPTLTYNSPYLISTYGTDNVTVRYPGFADLVLNFSYP